MIIEAYRFTVKYWLNFRIKFNMYFVTHALGGLWFPGGFLLGLAPGTQRVFDYGGCAVS